MIHHLDSLTVCLSRGVVLPGHGREMPAAAKAPAGFSNVSRDAPSPIGTTSEALLLDKHLGTDREKSPSVELETRGEHWVLRDL